MTAWYKKLLVASGGVRVCGGVRVWSSASGGDEEEEDGEGEGEGEEEEAGVLGLELLQANKMHAIAPVTIPNNFPEVPILAIARNPIFPRFVKILEVSPVKVLPCIYNLFTDQISDKELMKLIRQKVKLDMPYAGAFLKKDDRYVLSPIYLRSLLFVRTKFCGLTVPLTFCRY